MGYNEADTRAKLINPAPGQYVRDFDQSPLRRKERQRGAVAYKTSSTSILFLQHIIDSLKPGGRCAMVIDEGVLFRTHEEAYVKTKRKLLDDCNLHTIISLPRGLFSAASAERKNQHSHL